jgi:uridylate kinase
MQLRWKRVLIKLSGEGLAGSAGFGIDPAVVGRLADELVIARQLGVTIGLVIGGGNLFKGAWLAAGGLDRVTGDHMGIMATVMNGLAMREALAARGVAAPVLSGTPMPTICETFTQRGGLKHLAENGFAIFAGGIGSPFLTTDTTAAMRAAEMSCEVILKVTNVDGIYSADPRKDASAERFDKLTFDEAISRDLKVLDTAAFALARDNKIPIIVFSIQEPGALVSVLSGTGRSTLVTD